MRNRQRTKQPKIQRVRAPFLPFFIGVEVSRIGESRSGDRVTAYHVRGAVYCIRQGQTVYQPHSGLWRGDDLLSLVACLTIARDHALIRRELGRLDAFPPPTSGGRFYRIPERERADD